MNGGSVISAGAVLGPDPNWRVSHVGDLNGDGKADLVLRNTNGAVNAWLMNGINTIAAGSVLGADANWRVSHLADYNGDGKSDLLWRHNDGSITMWLMNGLSSISQNGILGPGAWRIVPIDMMPTIPKPDTGPSGASSKVFYIHADHLGTPRTITRSTDNVKVWEWENTEAFGNNLPNENPSALGTFSYNLRMQGQYFDKETGNFQKYFRDYDSSLGRYVQSDPIGLAAGPSTYGYVFANPLLWTDPYGLDVKVCFYADAAAGFGHIGFGISGESRTRGFYPKGSGFDSPGVIKIDSQDGMQCKTVSTDPKQEDCMAKCRKRREDDPGRYQLTSRQCTSFVRDCLSECGLLTSSYTGPKPRPFYQDLVAK